MPSPETDLHRVIATAHRDPQALLGAGLAFVAFALNSTVETILKLLTAGHPFYQLLAVNGCFALVVITLCALATGGLQRLRTAHPGLHLLRAAFGTTAGFLAIFAISHIPLTDFYAIVFAGPLIATALSALWLKETINLARWGAILLGFLGVLIITDPFDLLGMKTTDTNNNWLLIGQLATLGSVTAYCVSMLFVRRMRHSEANIVFSLFGYGLTVSVAFMVLMVVDAPALRPEDFMMLALSGTLGGIASIAMMTAFQKAPVALVAPFQYTQILWGALFGYLFWNHIPSAQLWLGASIVMVGGLYVLLQEVRLAAPHTRS